MQAIQIRVTFEATAPIAQSILAILKNFSKKEVQVIETQEFTEHTEVVQSDPVGTEPRLLTMEELYGSLKPYVDGRLSDADFDDAIYESAIDSGMAGTTHA